MVAFVHVQNDEAVLRVVDIHAGNISDPAKTRSLGAIETNAASPKNYQSTREKPKSGELCDECRSKRKNQDCK